jgi:4-hydroxy-tetrahydrodipicolinate synthase
MSKPPPPAAAARGLIVPIVTPFTPTGAVDVPALTAQARRLVDGGVDTVFVHGTTGEFYGLTLPQRRRVLDVVLEAVNARVPVVVGISGDSTASAIATLDACLDPRVAGYVASTPYLLPYTQPELADHFHALADAVGAPIILYNFPQRYRHRIELETVAGLVADGTACSIKDTAGDFDYLCELIRMRRTYPGFLVFESALVNLAKAAPLGIDGTVQAIGNLLPEECAELWGMVRDGRHDARLAEGVAALWKYHGDIEKVAIFMAALKGSMSLRGWCGARTAAPMRPAAGEQLTRLRALLDEFLGARKA